MLVVNLLVPVHLALLMIRSFSWGQHFLQRWIDLFSVFKMFTSTSRSPAPAVLLIEGQEFSLLMLAGENRGITRWNSDPRMTQRQTTVLFSSLIKTSHLAASSRAFTRNLQSSQPTPHMGLESPFVPPGRVS